jgi:CheY-like chemotaxis protein
VESADLISCERRAVEQFTAAFMERGVELVLAPYQDSERDWRVVGDSARIDRIFGNLLENALRYSKSGGRVSVGAVDEGKRVMAFVDDEGPGLPADSSHEQMFALFAKGKDRPGKAGLGLYFCKMTVERWGGEIGAENRPDGGSRFWFRLPRAKQEVGAKRSDGDAGAKTEAGEHVPPQKTTKALRILVADDNDTVRDFAVELLRSRGHQPEAVSDGVTALARIDDVAPEVILLDQEMPGMTGIDTARAIREKEGKAGAQRALIIGVSGDGSEEHRRLALEAGMDAFLTKPFDRGDLFRTVEAEPRSNGESKPAPRVGVEAARDGDLRAHLNEMTGGNEKILKKLIANFLADTPKKMAAIKRAVSSKDAEKLAATAHSLRGALAIFGAQKSVAARNLETMGKERRLDGAPREFGVLSEEIRRLEKQLHALKTARNGEKSKNAARRGQR